MNIGVSDEPEKPLGPEQRRAAILIGRGHSYEEAARGVGCTKRSIVRWMHRDDMRVAVAEAREGVLDSIPTARAVLEEALSATHPSGAPDWPSRIRAAAMLMKEGPPSDQPEPPRETRIYVEKDEDEDDGLPDHSPRTKMTVPEYR